MRTVGFMVGHAHYIPHARMLCDSILSLANGPGQGGLFAMVPKHLDGTLSIPHVTRIDFDVPEPLRKLPFADKLLAAAAFESVCGEDSLWLDVDSYFFKAPAFPERFEVLVNPVDKRNIGDAFGGPHGPIWRLLYDHFGIDRALADSRPVIATASGEAIYPYFNAGMVAMKENRGLFSTVARELQHLIARNDVREMLRSSAPNLIFFHQAVYTCALLKLYGMDGIRPLPKGVNYPLHLHEGHLNPLPPEEWVSIRYDTYFHDHDAPEPWRERFEGIRETLKMMWYYD